MSVINRNIFQNRRALVIGGTGGIGHSLALALAERGAAVAVTGGNSGKRLENALAALTAAAKAAAPENSAPGDVSGFLCKIGGPGGFSVEQAVQHILGKEPEPDILVCAWGPFQRARLMEADAESWRFLTESNLVFPGILVSSVIKGMLEREWGRILLFGGTGTAEIRGWITTAVYSTVKTALGTLVKSAARAAAGKPDVTCNAVCPGLTDTEYCSPEEKEYNRTHSPGGKALSPGDVALAALAILEDPHVNGTVVQVDGAGFDKIDRNY